MGLSAGEDFSALRRLGVRAACRSLLRAQGGACLSGVAMSPGPTESDGWAPLRRRTKARHSFGLRRQSAATTALSPQPGRTGR